MIAKALSALAASPARSMTDGGRTALFLCAGILAAACASASLVFACAAPIAAFAVLAAAVLPVRQALIAVATAWLVNQVIGFGILAYPRTLDAGVWGGIMLGAALVATFVAAGAFRLGARLRNLAIYPVALVVTYAAYELAMLAFTTALGGIEAFSGAIVGHLAFVNAIWLAGLIVAYELARRVVGLVRPDAIRQPAR